jgi:serine/threonine protein kinase/formylglycine-generating enzyme required for sulfatase activity
LLRKLITSEVYQLKTAWESYPERFPEYLKDIEKAHKKYDREASSRTETTSNILDIMAPEGDEISTVVYKLPHHVGDLLDGRYRLDRKLGSGAFGTVFLAYDKKIKRIVAVKTVNKDLPSDYDFNPEKQIREAELGGNLVHPNIVPVFTVGEDNDGDIFIVSQYIDCTTLRDELDNQKAFDHQQIATFVLSIAQALYAADCKGIIHRDIKPANILIERETQKVYVADFGLAVRDDDYLEKTLGAGSPAYKSPEQVRCEGHRINGRSDLFSLGIVMYEMLTGERLFQGSRKEIAEQIKYYYPPNPSSLKLGIPPELDRICMKLLQKDPLDRYKNGQVLAKDIQAWLASQEHRKAEKPRAPATIKPRGLRSFNETDADFFLELLPGLRDAQGIPECVSFWTDRIQSRDRANAFCAGMIMGPSGSGKSSLVKAGIIPLLKNVTAIHLDATPADTEARLLKALKNKLPGLRETTTLTEAMIQIRRSEDPRVVVFIDQFEQWLSSNKDDKHSELTSALRQCDGKTLQVVLIIRDDFGSAIRFMTRDLETLIDEKSNFATVRPFDTEHAKKVLIKFGQAYGKLPEDPQQMSSAQYGFIDRAIRELRATTQDNGVVPVILSVFAEMTKSKPWEAQTLESMGGASGILSAFLDESFGLANPQNRIHQTAASGVLKALLPAVGVDLKGQAKSKQELMESSGYTDKPTNFEELIDILDRKLRLIKLVEDQQDRYQLTHDFMIAPLREWLSRKQRETLRGRTELVLAERAEAWSTRKESKQLPTFFEWLKIRLLTGSRTWNLAQQSMMKRSDVQNITMIGWLMAACVILTVSYAFIQTTIEQEKVLFQWMNNPTEQLLALKPKLKQHSVYMNRELQATLSHESPQREESPWRLSDKKTRALLGLMCNGMKFDRNWTDAFWRSIIAKPQSELLALRGLVSSEEIGDIQGILHHLDQSSNPNNERISAAAIISSVAKNDLSWLSDERCEFLADALTTTSPEEFSAWINVFTEKNVGLRLLPYFQKNLKDQSGKTTTQKVFTARAIAKFAKNQPDQLASAITHSTMESYPSLLAALRECGNPAKIAVKNSYEREKSWNGNLKTTKAVETTIDPNLQLIFENNGLINENFAFLTSIPINEFKDSVEKLKEYGYRPTRIRPHISIESVGQKVATDPVLNISAVFARDSKSFAVEWNLVAKNLPKEQSPAVKRFGQDLFTLEDIAITTREESGEPKFVALWVESHEDDQDRYVLLDINEKQLIHQDQAMNEQNACIRLSVSCDLNEQPRYCAIYQRGIGNHIIHLRHKGTNLLSRPIVDVACSQIGRIELVDFTKTVTATQEKSDQSKNRISDVENPLLTTIAHYRNKDYRKAVDIAEATLQHSNSNFSPLRLWRLLALVHLQDDAYHSEYENHINSVPNEADKAYAEIRYMFITQGFQEAKKRIDFYLNRYANKPYGLLSIVCAASGCASETSDESEKKELISIALSEFERVLTFDYFTLTDILAESDLVLLYNDPIFLNSIHQFASHSPYVSISTSNAQTETLLVEFERSDPRNGQESPSVSDLIIEGWEPKSIAHLLTFLADQERYRSKTLVLFERSLEDGNEKDARHKRAALSALAMHHLGDSSLAMDVMASSVNDNSIKSYLQAFILEYATVVPTDISGFYSAFLKYGSTTESQAPSWKSTEAKSVAITLGDFAERNLLSSDQRESILAHARRLLKDDTDSGVHAACQWLLLKIGEENAPVEQQEFTESINSHRSRTWFTTRTNQPTLEHTLAIIGPDEFIAGSPIHESGRANGPSGFDEFPHEVKIPYRVAISMHETTVKQFRRFSPNRIQAEEVIKGNQDAPIHGITWFEAVDYCNWLSEQEKTPEEQWCYTKSVDGSYVIPDDYLRRTGYRLPTIDEYEYACRSGSITSRPFGDSKELLKRFAWSVSREQEQYTISVGSLRPNPWGFFDLLGNVEEWSSDIVALDETVEQLALKTLGRSSNRIRDVPIFPNASNQAALFGGAYNNSTRMLRSASRHYYLLASSFDSVGFRVARTVDY